MGGKGDGVLKDIIEAEYLGEQGLAEISNIKGRALAGVHSADIYLVTPASLCAVIALAGR